MMNLRDDAGLPDKVSIPFTAHCPGSCMHLPRFRWLFFILVALTASAATWHFLQPQRLEVRVQPVSRGLVEKVIANTRAGTLKACREANLSPAVGGQIARLPVKKGESVLQGQLLLELWNQDLTAQLRLAESEAKSAEAKVEAAREQAEIAAREATRLLRLQKTGAVSEQDTDSRVTAAKVREAEYTAARAAAATSRARLNVIRAEFQRTRLVAPFAGIVAEINGELNEYVTPSPPGIATPPTVVLLDTACYYVTAPIDEVDAPEVKVGMPARIILDAYGDRHFNGTVRRISSYVLDAEKQARTVDVEVAFSAPQPDTHLLAGYSADVEIVANVSNDTLHIPTQAIIDGKKVYVFTVADNRIHSREITTGIGNWEQTEIIRGLKEGEKVVLSIDQEGITDNAQVVVKEGP